MILAFLLLSQIQQATITVEPNHVLNRISPAMFGSCIEDVNHEIYGGLYGQRLFGESFEEPGVVSGPAGWRALGGKWSSDGSTIRCPAGDGPMLVLDQNGIQDAVVTAQLQVAKGQEGSAGLIVRVSNAQTGIDNFDGYEIALRAKAGQLALGKHHHDYKLLQEVPAPVAPGESHQLRVELAGPRIQIFLDSETTPRIDFIDTDHPLISGTIALRPWQADSEFRDIAVDKVPISPKLVDGGISGMWEPIGPGSFKLEGNAFNGKQCQKIVHDATPGIVGVANRGLNRWGIAVEKGHAFDGQLALRGDAATAIVALQSADGKQTYAEQRLEVTSNWANRSFHLTPNITDRNARFAILLDHKGTLSADQAVLLCTDRFHGLNVRKDIAQSMVSGKLSFLRYGGTMVNVPGYRWKNMIGDPARRPPYQGNWYPYSTNGFGIFDFLQFCEAAKIPCAFAMNVEESAQDAADLADYLSAPTSNRWGRQRAADGHPVPYHPEYIEIGNEEAIGAPNQANLAHYAERFRILERAIHSRNPKLKLVCAAWWVPDSPDMKSVFDAIDGKAVAWDFHFWSDDANAGTNIDHELTRAESLFKSWNPNTNLKVVVFEENGNRHDLQRALGHATTVNATRRHGDFVIADCAANCLQPWQQNDNGWDQGQIFFTPNHVWVMPPYDVNKILAEDALPLRVESKSDPSLDVLATRSEDGNTVVLSVVNVGDQPIQTSIHLDGFQARACRMRSLSGDPKTTNPPRGARSVTPRETKLAVTGGPVNVKISAHSFTSIRLSRQFVGGTFPHASTSEGHPVRP